MKNILDKSQEEIRDQAAVSAEDPEFNEAVDRVRSKYGSDLQAFFREVQSQFTLKSQDIKIVQSSCAQDYEAEE